MQPWILVLLGGALGSLSRWLLGSWLGFALGGLWWGTLTVNLLGCLGLGAAWASLERWGAGSHGYWLWISPLIMVGFFGGFTTLSGLQKDVWQLIQAHAWGPLLIYSGLSWLGGLLCLLVGRWLIVGGKV